MEPVSSVRVLFKSPCVLASWVRVSSMALFCASSCDCIFCQARRRGAVMRGADLADGRMRRGSRLGCAARWASAARAVKALTFAVRSSTWLRVVASADVGLLILGCQILARPGVRETHSRRACRRQPARERDRRRLDRKSSLAVLPGTGAARPRSNPWCCLLKRRRPKADEYRSI